MGATLSTESVLTAVVLVGAAGFGYHQYATNLSDAASNTGPSSSTTKQRPKKKKKGPEQKEPPSSLQTPTLLVGAPSTSSSIPGQFDDLPQPSLISKSKKSKKKKSQHSTTDLDTATTTTTITPHPPPSTSDRHSQPLQQSTTASLDTGGSWTRVSSHRKAGKGGDQSTIDVTTTSDAGITPTVTENSSPTDEESTDERTTLAEKLVPKAPKTEVDELS